MLIMWVNKEIDLYKNKSAVNNSIKNTLEKVIYRIKSNNEDGVAIFLNE